MDRVPNERIRELCGVKRVGNDKFAKRVYVGECAGSHSVDISGGGDGLIP